MVIPPGFVSWSKKLAYDAVEEFFSPLSLLSPSRQRATSSPRRGFPEILLIPHYQGLAALASVMVTLLVLSMSEPELRHFVEPDGPSALESQKEQISSQMVPQTSAIPVPTPQNSQSSSVPSRPTKQAVTPPSPEPTEEEETAPPPVKRLSPSMEEEPASAPPLASEPAPVQEEPWSSPPANAGIDQFKEMEGFVVEIATLSEKAFEAYEEEGREDELYNRLEAFHEAALGTKREFRKATGMGLRGTFSKMRGESGDTKALEIKVDDLTRRADEIDLLIDSSSTITQEHWRELRSTLRKLKGHL